MPRSFTALYSLTKRTFRNNIQYYKQSNTNTTLFFLWTFYTLPRTSSVLGENVMRRLLEICIPCGDSLLAHEDDELFSFSNLGRQPNALLSLLFSVPQNYLNSRGQIDHIHVFIWLADYNGWLYNLLLQL